MLLAILIIGDPGRIDRNSVWLRVMTGTLIGLISVVNVAAVARLVAGIINAVKFSNDAARPRVFSGHLLGNAADPRARCSCAGRLSSAGGPLPAAAWYQVA